MPKIETPEEFAQKIENAIAYKYIKSPNGRGGVMEISKDYIPAVKIIAERDAAIRAESAALLKMCGEALKSIDSWWRLPNRERTIESIEPAMRKTIEALAALRDAGVM